jgi:hypothetical protein
MRMLDAERERLLLTALRALAADCRDPGIDPARELALISEFDWRQKHRAGHPRFPVWIAVAAALLVTAAITWRPAPGPDTAGDAFASATGPAPGLQQSRAADAVPIEPGAPDGTLMPAAAVSNTDSIGPSDEPEFVVWPYATAWPPFESGELIRLEVGFDGTVVEADVLVDQDGFARAVRLIE